VPVPAPPKVETAHVSAVSPAPPRARAAAVAESTAAFTGVVEPSPVIEYADVGATAVAAKAARAPTVLAPQSSETSMAELTAVSGPYSGRRFRVEAQEFWIGSAANNHLCLSADQGVSNNHACIRREVPFFRLYDHGSLNNTWLNGRPLGQEVALLHTGDRIRVGQSEFLIEVGA
jgi:FHA domain